MKITSPVFENNQNIPQKFTCDGDNFNPALLFSGVPQGTKSLALILHDPDALMEGEFTPTPREVWGFTHWVVWNINPALAGFEENSVPEGINQGLNDANKHSYVGPCPPRVDKRQRVEAGPPRGTHPVREKSLQATEVAPTGAAFSNGTHRYFFKLYALNDLLSIDPNSNKAALEKAMEGHILEEAELVGLYARK